MATKETKAINNVNESNVNNATANASAKVESNEQSNESNASTTTAPTEEEIASAKVIKKHETEIANRYTLDEPKEVERTKFVGATVLGVWRAPKDVKKNGDKTFFKVYYNGTIYDGYTSTEFCDTVGIERKHRAGNTPKATTLLDKLTALKSAIEAIDSDETDFVNFAKIVQTKIVNEHMKNLRVEFVAKYAAAITFFPKLTEQDFAEENGAETLALAKKLGYKFADTMDTMDTMDTNESK